MMLKSGKCLTCLLDRVARIRHHRLTYRESVLDKFDHLKNLAIMSAADGSLSEQEVSLLIDRCTELGLNEDHLEEAIAFALSKQAALTLPMSVEEQEKLLEDMIRVMAADGQLAESEKRLFAFAAAKMGFPKDRLNLLIDRLVKSVSDSNQAL